MHMWGSGELYCLIAGGTWVQTCFRSPNTEGRSFSVSFSGGDTGASFTKGEEKTRPIIHSEPRINGIITASCCCMKNAV